MRYIVITILFILCAVPVWATDYYVTADGAGTEDGSSLANAYAGFSDAETEADLAAGDTLYIAGTFREHLTPWISGTDGNIITFKSYDADPAILLGSTQMDGTGDWSDSLGGNLWRTTTTFTYNVGFVLFGSESEANVGTREDTQGAVNADKEFYYDATNDWIVTYTDDDSNPFTYYGAVEVGTAEDELGSASLIEVSNTDYLEFEGLTLKYFDGHGIEIRNGADYITVDGCSFSYGGGQSGASSRYGAGVTVQYNTTNITIQNCTASQIYDFGLGCAELWDIDSGTYTIDTVTCDNNTVDQCGGGIQVAGSNGGSGGTYAISNITVSNNTITNIGSGWSGETSVGSRGMQMVSEDSDVTNNDNITITGNSIDTALGEGMYLLGATNLDCSKNTITGAAETAIFVGTESGSYQDTSGDITSNIIYDNTQWGIRVIRADGTLNLYNNTMVDNGDGSSYFNLECATDADNVTAKNNIIAYSNGTSDESLSIWSGAGNSITLDYNLYYGSSTQVVYYKGTYYGASQNWSTYAALQDANSPTPADPLITSSHNLQSTSSPAYNAAVDVGLTRDNANVGIPMHGAFDIGALEYVETLLNGVTLTGVTIQ